MARGYRTCALTLALTFLIATAIGNGRDADGRGCQKCRPGCPMHAAENVGSHHGSDIGCHHGHEPGVRCACGNHSETSTTPLPVWRAVLAPNSVGGVRVVESRAVQAVHALTTQFILEPPTDPPRTAAV